MGPLVDPGLREQLDRLVQRIIQMFSVTLDDYYGNEENIAVIRGIIDRIIQIDQSNRTGQGQLVPITTGRSSDQVADNGILITGLPGTGKTYLSDCISNEYGVKVYKVGPEEMLGLDKGRSSRQTRDVDQLIAKTNEITEQAAEHSKREVCMLFIDEFGKYAPDRTKPNITPDQETYVDYLLQRVEFLRKNYPNLIIFAATNKELEDLEPAMIREGRFDVLLKFAPPTVADIKQMFEKTLAAHVESGSLDDQRITAIAEKALGLMPQSVIKAVITALITASLEDREFTIDDLETSIGLKVAGRSIDISRNRPAVEAKAGE